MSRGRLRGRPGARQSIAAEPQEELQNAAQASCAFGAPIAKLSRPPGVTPLAPGPRSPAPHALTIFSRPSVTFRVALRVSTTSRAWRTMNS